MGVSTEQSSHVLNDHDPWAQAVDSVGEFEPEAGSSAGGDTSPPTRSADVLAWEPATQDDDGFDGRPVHCGDVAEVRDTWPSMSEHLRRSGVDLAVPHRSAAEELLYGHVQAAGAREQRSDTHQHRTLQIGQSS
jgi:hypothetical protein